MRERRADRGPHLDGIRTDGDPAFARDPDRGQGAVGAAAEILGDAGEAGADEDPGLLLPRFLGRPLPPDRVLVELSRISPVRVTPASGLPVMVFPPVGRAFRRRNSIGSTRSVSAASSISTSSAVIVC
jgi:hypothetical protein